VIKHPHKGSPVWQAQRHLLPPSAALGAAAVAAAGQPQQQLDDRYAVWSGVHCLPDELGAAGLQGLP
jgi:hypothetical protein